MAIGTDRTEGHPPLCRLPLTLALSGATHFIELEKRSDERLSGGRLLETG